MKEKIVYYSLKPILSVAPNAYYYMIIGERSNGKTYSVLKLGLENYLKTGKETAILRRWAEDIKVNACKKIWKNIIENKEIEKLSKGKFNNLYIYGSSATLCFFDNEKGEITRKDTKPFCHFFAVSLEERYKEQAYPDVTTILYDEFLTRGLYIQDEFIAFENLLSTIIRLRTDVKIFMCANTINKYSPYFNEMGLKRIPKMKKGTIDVYEYGDSGLTVAVEYCDFSKHNKQSKPSNVYFAFDNPKLKMIREGDWEIDLYPHLPFKYLPKHVVYYFFIEFADSIIKGEVIQMDQYHFIFFAPKTTPYNDNDKHHLVRSFKTNVEPNYRRYFKATGEIEKKILKYFALDKVFYATNEVGEIVRNFMLEQNIKLPSLNS